MKNIRKISAIALIIVTGFLSQNVGASSYPAVGTGVGTQIDNSLGSQVSTSSSGYVAPASTPAILGGSGTAADPYLVSELSGPEQDAASSIYFYTLTTGGGFMVGDTIKDSDNGDLYKLVDAGNGYLKAILLSGSGDAELGDGSVFFLLPIGNGNVTLAVLILTYGFYIFYRKKKKEKTSTEIKESYPLG